MKIKLTMKAFFILGLSLLSISVFAQADNAQKQMKTMMEEFFKQMDTTGTHFPQGMFLQLSDPKALEDMMKMMQDLPIEELLAESPFQQFMGKDMNIDSLFQNMPNSSFQMMDMDEMRKLMEQNMPSGQSLDQYFGEEYQKQNPPKQKKSTKGKKKRKTYSL